MEYANVLLVIKEVRLMSNHIFNKYVSKVSEQDTHFLTTAKKPILDDFKNRKEIMGSILSKSLEFHPKF